MTLYNPTARRVWTLGDGTGPVSLSGAATTRSAVLDIREVCDLGLYIAVGGTITGTAATLDVQVDGLDPAGNMYPQLVKARQVLNGTTFATASAGLHIMGASSLVLPELCQVVITLGGTTPAFGKVSATLIGR